MVTAFRWLRATVGRMQQYRDSWWHSCMHVDQCFPQPLSEAFFSISQTHKETLKVQGVRNFETFSPKLKAFIKYLSSRFRGLCTTWRQGNCKNQRWWMIPTMQCLPDIPRLTHIWLCRYWQHVKGPHQSKSNGSQALRRTQDPTSNQEAICN